MMESLAEIIGRLLAGILRLEGLEEFRAARIREPKKLFYAVEERGGGSL